MIAIRQEAARLEQLGEAYRPFVAEVRRMTKSFNLKELSQWLTPYLRRRRKMNTATLNQGTILIVDDTPTNLAILVDYLAERGFDISVSHGWTECH